ncbi:hypothetical protein KP78_16660 [Jeotgalibacillus soli]|uniref:Uncharacterized protein n=1 Tax=Jeotgalibacillus soli TaxID=889306 RepID=A0A0C2S2H7_9BACL|nr:hypothetical protein KP78_16660 [Jeotgalibacillus soli]
MPPTCHIYSAHHPDLIELAILLKDKNWFLELTDDQKIVFFVLQQHPAVANITIL